MQIAFSKTREQFPLSPKKILKKTISGMIFHTILIFLIYLLVFTSFITEAQKSGLFPVALAEIAFAITLGIIVLTTFVNYFYQRWYFATYFYDLTDDFIVIRKGPITPSEITIPY